ncbi:UbiA family prenyltransferase [Weissella minor]|uniref:Prenyltransferase n=1 Tax=Weissella minor TaxID=1620 RepID=A0A0R2JF28_9LACO|nr:UbiA family prenyltransferase [Weissella minor]KRN75954.1 prenyltransferase [Weissella minor]
MKNLLKLLEVQSLVAAALPLMLGFLYTLNVYQQFNGVNALVFALIAFALQMGVNVWNNLQDFRAASSEEWKNGVNNIVGAAGYTVRQVGLVLFILVGFAGIAGLWLVTRTGWPLLIMGLIGFLVAYWYAGTPLPLSRTPFGELASGLTMGYLIFLAAVYVNVAPLLTWTLIWHAMVASAIAWFAIADIMLANNIGDYEEDLAEGRRTLVALLGKPNALRLFVGIYVAGYVVLIIAVVLGILPWPSLLALISAPVVFKQVRQFQADPQKKNFPLAIKNVVLISITLALGLIIALFI